MVLEIHKPNIPKQERSLKRYKSALDTADLVLKEQSIHAVTLKEIAIRSGIKRSSLYKFFPSNIAILYALSEKHLNKLLKMVNANTTDVNFKDSMDFTMLIIDLLAIYLNEHKGSAIMFLSNDLPTQLDITLQSTTLFSSEMLNKMNQKVSDADNERVNNNFSIIFALLSRGYQKEGTISPRIVNETKKASLAYLSAY
jgi:AcrR family transcriptional regulator